MTLSNNPFEAYEIEHFSASAINTYIADPCMYILRYVFKHRGYGNPSMWRGTVVDESIGEILLNGKSLDFAIKHARNRYKGLFEYHADMFPIDQTRYENERLAIPKYLEVAYEFYKEMGEPVSYQKKIELQLDILPIPIIGYIDLQYPNLVRDIKTVSRLPSKIPDGVCRQLSIYALAEDSDAIVDYVNVNKTRSQVVSMQVNDVDKHIEVVKRGALAIMNLLSVSNDKYEIANLFYPNFDSFYWSKEDIEVAKTIWC